MSATPQLEQQEPPQIGVMSAADRDRWDAYVDAHPEGTFFHRSGWQTVLQRAFGHTGHYLFAEQGGALAGILPLGHVRSRLFANSLVSTPFCVYGGVLASTDAAAAELNSAACRLAERLGVDFLEMRNRNPGAEGWPAKDLYVTFRGPIPSGDDAILRSIPRKQRAMVRKGMAAGLTVTIDRNLDDFYRCYAESVRNLGTPVFGRRYFRVLAEEFSNELEVLTVRQAGVAVSSVLSFYFRDEVLPYYGGGTSAARALKANDFMYWELMRHAGRRGVGKFDFGRSKQGTGSFRFKKHWGFTPQPLHYEYYLVNCSEMPDVSPNNPRYRLFINLWKRLPLPVADRLGPWLARSLG